MGVSADIENSIEKKCLVAMSGGVDSSVAVYLMKEKGYSPIGVTMMLHDQDLSCTAGTHLCCTPDDIEDARLVCSALGVPFYVVNFMDGFREKIIDNFIETYLRGETPNPCIDCNRYMKFGRLFGMADEKGCEKVVTGHYARIEYDESKKLYRLKRAVDRTKDQTYVLYSLTQEQLAHAAFPLGEYTDKEEIREIARHHGFVNSGKPDSQDICFVPAGKYADFIERRTGKPAPEGDFVDEEGHVLGRHKGLIRYTIGQRRGLGLALPAPLYVSRIDTEKNQVVLTPQSGLFSGRLIAEDFNWIWTPDWGKWSEAPEHFADGDTETPPVGYSCEVTAKPRYRAKEAAATARVLEGGKVEILFHEPQRALTIGQAVVLYIGENVVGGGTICEVPKEKQE